jgi:hypothetical protein
MMRLPEGPGSRVLLVVRQSDVLERHYKKLLDDVAKNIGVSGWALTRLAGHHATHAVFAIHG